MLAVCWYTGCTCVHTLNRPHSQSVILSRTHTSTHTLLCTCTYVHTHIHAHTQAHTHSYAHVCTHTHTYTHTHTCTHTHTHTHTHTEWTESSKTIVTYNCAVLHSMNKQLITNTVLLVMFTSCGCNIMSLEKHLVRILVSLQWNSSIVDTLGTW